MEMEMGEAEERGAEIGVEVEIGTGGEEEEVEAARMARREKPPETGTTEEMGVGELRAAEEGNKMRETKITNNETLR